MLAIKRGEMQRGELLCEHNGGSGQGVGELLLLKELITNPVARVMLYPSGSSL